MGENILKVQIVLKRIYYDSGLCIGVNIKLWEKMIFSYAGDSQTQALVEVTC